MFFLLFTARHIQVEQSCCPSLKGALECAHGRAWREACSCYGSQLPLPFFFVIPLHGFTEGRSIHPVTALHLYKIWKY